MAEDRPHEGQVSLAYSERTTPWIEAFSEERRELVEGQLRRLAREMARDPKGGIVRWVDGEPVRIGFIRIDDGEIWGYRVDLVNDERMRRSGIPAIVVKGARPMPYPGR